MLRTDISQFLTNTFGKKNPPQLRAGDTVKVHQKIREGDKERIQIFEGLVIAIKHGRGLDASFTVRKVSVGGIAVERVYPLHSPNVVKVERVKHADVRRAKLYYMRERFGKRARFKSEAAAPMSWEEPVPVAEPEIPAEIEEEVAETPEIIEETEAPEAEPEAEAEVVAEEPEASDPKKEE